MYTTLSFCLIIIRAFGLSLAFLSMLISLPAPAIALEYFVDGFMGRDKRKDFLVRPERAGVSVACDGRGK